MNTRPIPTRLLCLSFVAALGLACDGGGSDPAPSGHYSFDMPGNTVALEFKDGGRVTSSVTEFGDTESMECSYKTKGSNVTITCPEGEPRTLTFRDGALEANMGDATFKFTKR